MKRPGPALSWLVVLLLVGAGPGETTGEKGGRGEAPPIARELQLVQHLVNESPVAPGHPDFPAHCPTGPGRWVGGHGRSTATSNVFGDLTQVEAYCINVDRRELSGGEATWTDADGDTIRMTFTAAMLAGFAYPPPPTARLVGTAVFVGGTGKWSGLVGHAQFSGQQGGAGEAGSAVAATAKLDYRGSVYLPERD